jgi:hypothetical protein
VQCKKAALPPQAEARAAAKRNAEAWRIAMRAIAEISVAKRQRSAVTPRATGTIARRCDVVAPMESVARSEVGRWHSVLRTEFRVAASHSDVRHYGRGEEQDQSRGCHRRENARHAMLPLANAAHLFQRAPTYPVSSDTALRKSKRPALRRACTSHRDVA